MVFTISSSARTPAAVLMSGFMFASKYWPPYEKNRERHQWYE